MELTTFERRMLSFVLAIEAPELLQGICSLHVAKREFTGAGVFVDFERPADVAASGPSLRTLGNLAFATQEGWDDIVRCQIAASGDVLVMAEFFANSRSDLPENLEGARLGYLADLAQPPS